MALIARSFRGLFIALFALFGASMTVVGASLPKILADFSWGYGAAGLVLAANAAAYFASSFAAGYCLRRFGAKTTVATGLLACAAGLAFFAADSSWALNLILNFLIGAGQGLLDSTVNWSVVRMDKQGSGRAMNFMHGAFALGAVAGPLGVGFLLGANLAWTVLYRIIAALFALLSVVLALLPFDRLGADAEAASTPESRSNAKLAGRPSYWLGFVCLLLYVGVELGVSNWIAEYFVRVFSADASFGAFMVSLFWIGLLAGRFGAPAAYRGSRQDVLLAGSAVLLAAAVAAINLLGFFPDTGVAVWLGPGLTFLAGLGCSVVYPLVISLVGGSSPDAQARAVSFSVAGGGVGVFVFPFAMSWISEAWGIRAGFLSYAFIALLTCAACFALAKVWNAQRPSI